MSSYRDDIQDTVVAANTTWMKLTTLTSDQARISATLLFALLGVIHDHATATDLVMDRNHHASVDQVHVSEAYSDHLHAYTLFQEQVRIRVAHSARVHAWQTETVQIGDGVIERLRPLLTETARASDHVMDVRRVHSLIVETAGVRDVAPQFAAQLTSETVQAAASVQDSLRARVLVATSARVEDAVFDSLRLQGLLTDSASAKASVQDQLHAADLVADGVLVADDMLGMNGLHGQAWSANTQTWAMSRYAPYTFIGVAVLDGVLYGVAEDGIYALEGGTATIAATIQTGALDLGQGALVRPLSAYLEYELAGSPDKSAQLEVTTTQAGTPAHYLYRLPDEMANALTNGRFVFGRGLCGRHFTFTLHLQGQRGSVHDLTVDVASTNRRI